MTTLAQMKRIALYAVMALVLYTVVSSPDRSAEFVRLAFEAVSAAALGMGDLAAGVLTG